MLIFLRITNRYFLETRVKRSLRTQRPVTAGLGAIGCRTAFVSDRLLALYANEGCSRCVAGFAPEVCPVALGTIVHD